MIYLVKIILCPYGIWLKAGVFTFTFCSELRLKGDVAVRGSDGYFI